MFDGVKVDSVEVGKLYTYFEPYEINIGNVVNLGKAEQVPDVNIMLHNYRLNHKPFTYNIELTSDKDAQAYVRVYMAPKYDYLGHEYSLSERRKYYFEIDQFPYHGELNLFNIQSHPNTTRGLRRLSLAALTCLLAG